jgi:hypothetical protein
MLDDFINYGDDDNESLLDRIEPVDDFVERVDEIIELCPRSHRPCLMISWSYLDEKTSLVDVYLTETINVLYILLLD